MKIGMNENKEVLWMEFQQIVFHSFTEVDRHRKPLRPFLRPALARVAGSRDFREMLAGLAKDGAEDPEGGHGPTFANF